ncbi:hypothetical protein BRN03_00535, partial [Xanthomonas oryzae pv. oryzae]
YTENAPKTAKNQGFERPQRRRCGLLHFPAALIRPSLASCHWATRRAAIVGVRMSRFTHMRVCAA